MTIEEINEIIYEATLKIEKINEDIKMNQFITKIWIYVQIVLALICLITNNTFLILYSLGMCLLLLLDLFITKNIIKHRDNLENKLKIIKEDRLEYIQMQWRKKR